MNAKIIAIVAVVVIVAGGAGAFMVLNNGNGAKNVERVDTALAVYGNANNDTVINNNDVTLIQEIIDGKKVLKDYPFASRCAVGVVRHILRDRVSVGGVRRVEEHRSGDYHQYCYSDRRERDCTLVTLRATIGHKFTHSRCSIHRTPISSVSDSIIYNN